MGRVKQRLRRMAERVGRTGVPRPESSPVASDQTSPVASEQTEERTSAAPTVSVIVALDDRKVDESLRSLTAQSFRDVEIVMVAVDGFEGAHATAQEYADRDPHLRLVAGVHPDQGAARNVGVDAARGHYLVFVEAGDTLPKRALARMIGSAEATGSELVVGVTEWSDRSTSRAVSWPASMPAERRQRTRPVDLLPLIRGFDLEGALFRADFWRALGPWLADALAADIPSIGARLFGGAETIDVLTEVVYRRREPATAPDVSPTLAELRAVAARWRRGRDLLADEVAAPIDAGWVRAIVEDELPPYLHSGGVAEDAYWAELSATVRALARDGGDDLWVPLLPSLRVPIRLILDERRADLQEFLSQGGSTLRRWPPRLRDDGVFVELPLHDDPDLPDDLFLVRPDQLMLVHTIERVFWSEDDAGAALQLEGWAYLRQVDLAGHPHRVTVLLRNERTGEVHAEPVTGSFTPALPPPDEDAFCDYSAGSFRVAVPAEKLLAGAGPGDRWLVLVSVELTDQPSFGAVTRPVTHLGRPGSAVVAPTLVLPDGCRLIGEWHSGQPLRIAVDDTGVRVTDVVLEGRTLIGSVDPGSEVVRVVVASPRGRAAAEVTEGRFRVELPLLDPPPAHGRQLGWRLTGRTADGKSRGLVPVDMPGDQRAAGHPLVPDRGVRGELRITESTLSAVADRIWLSDAGELWVGGHLTGAPGFTEPTEVAIRTRHHRAQACGDRVPVESGRFEAPVPLEHEVYRFGALPLPIGQHELVVVGTDDDGPGGEQVELPLLPGAGLEDRLPQGVVTERHEGRLVRSGRGTVRLILIRPQGTTRGPYQQRRLQLDPPRTEGLIRGVLFRANQGEAATDNGLAIQRVLQERGVDLPVYWAIDDHAIPVPDGATPVITGSREWYRLLHNIGYYVDNWYQPGYTQKRPGQVFVQTFHGYPFKGMGHPHWERLGFSRAVIDSYDRRAREWDHLVSPARYATPLLTRDFAYDGDVLEIGYPRNDVLLSPEAPALRRVVRESFGIHEDQTVVLYAPTFRDYLARGSNRAAMPDFFDFDAAASALGEEYVVLVRGHAFNARAQQRVGHRRGIIDVTDYPEISDLLLAADAAVVDFSSLRFDFGLTGKPMVFHVPDLQRYQDSRGWLLDFEPTAPGPLCATTDQVVAELQDLDTVRATHADAYQRFHDDFLDLDDGHAAERFVDAVFGSRGDA